MHSCNCLLRQDDHAPGRVVRHGPRHVRGDDVDPRGHLRDVRVRRRHLQQVHQRARELGHLEQAHHQRRARRGARDHGVRHLLRAGAAAGEGAGVRARGDLPVPAAVVARVQNQAQNGRRGVRSGGVG